MDNPFVLAFIKFAILGTAGELAAKLISKRKLVLWQIFYSMLVWGVLGVLIKFVFTGFHGFTENLIAYGYLPEGTISVAFFTSLFTNAMFGPWIVILHRLFDNLPNKTFSVPREGLKGAMLTLVWFWIPAHTVTFALDKDWQITLAAIWSFVLGLILGFFNRGKKG
jgi:hypothetical protein